MTTTFSELDKPTIQLDQLDKVTFDGTVYNEVTKSADNILATTQLNSNLSYDNFLLHSSKEWLSTLEDITSDLVKETKDTSDRIKQQNKVIDGINKAAPDAAPFKDTSAKLQEGVKDLSESSKAMAQVYDYTGAINFISSTSVNTVAGSIVSTSDLGMFNRSPSITNIANTKVDKISTSFQFSDTSLTQDDKHITITNQRTISASDDNKVVSNTTSTTSSDNKTTAVNSHQVVTNEQALYNNTTTVVAKEAAIFGSGGPTTVIGQTGITIAAGQTNKTTASGASTDPAPTEILPELPPPNIELLSIGDITSKANGSCITSGDTIGNNCNKFGVISIDNTQSSTTTAITSKAQTVVTSDALTYNGTQNTGILVTPTAILAGTGLAPLIPILGEVLPPIIIDLPELPEFPFGSLADFLSKCLPFNIATPTTINNNSSTTNTDITTSVGNGEIITSPVLNPAEPPPLEVAPEPPLVVLEPQSSTQPTTPTLDEPVDISLEDPLVQPSKTSEPASNKQVKANKTDRAVDEAPVQSNQTKNKQHNTKGVVIAASQLGILHPVLQRPEDVINPNKNTTQSTSIVPEISPQLTYGESLKSITNLQQFEVVQSFSKDIRPFITGNYSDFTKAIAIVETSGITISTDYPTTINNILSDKSIVNQIQTFINTKRPIGQGGQQPPNIQDDISNPISDLNSGGNNFRTPATPGQGILDTMTVLGEPSTTTKMSILRTTPGWFSNNDQIANIDPNTVTDFKFGDELIDNANLAGISELLNNKYVDTIKGLIPDSKIQSALSLTQDIAAGRITTPQEYARAIANVAGGEIATYITYAEQAFNIYQQVEQGNYTALLDIPGVSNVLGSKGTAVASKVLSLISKKNITDKDIYDVAGSIFTALTGIGIPLLDELAKLLGCIDSLKQTEPFLQSISNPDLQDIIDYLPRIIQSAKDNNVVLNINPDNSRIIQSAKDNNVVLNINPDNCGQVIELSAEEATITVIEIGPSYIKFKLDSRDLIRFNNNPLPDIGTYVNVYSEFYTDRVTNKVLLPYKVGTQFTSNIIEYVITSRNGSEYTATLINTNTILTLEDNITGSLYEYRSIDIGNRLAPYILDSYILL